MRRLIAACVAVVALASANGAWADGDSLIMPNATPTDLRTTAVLTTSDVQSTSFTLPSDAKAVVFYAQVEHGSASSVTITPAIQPAGTGITYKLGSSAWTLPTTDGYYAKRFDAFELGGRAVSVYCKAASSGASSGLIVRYRIEYKD